MDVDIFIPFIWGIVFGSALWNLFRWADNLNANQKDESRFDSSKLPKALELHEIRELKFASNIKRNELTQYVLYFLGEEF